MHRAKTISPLCRAILMRLPIPRSHICACTDAMQKVISRARPSRHVLIIIIQMLRSRMLPSGRKSLRAMRRKYTSSLTTTRAITRRMPPCDCGKPWTSSSPHRRRLASCFELILRVDERTFLDGPRLPGPLARLKRWLTAHHMTLMTIADSPHSIALGSAIGIFFGFTPLWTMKTLLSIGVAWLFNSNKIAAAISVTLHDVILPFWPAIYLAEYKIGYWILQRPSPQRLRITHFQASDYLHWGFFLRVVWPALI